MLLPTHYERAGLGITNAGIPAKAGRIRLGDVWDEREELFGIGDSDSEDDGEGGAASRSRPPRSPAVATPLQGKGPKIVVTSS